MIGFWLLVLVFVLLLAAGPWWPYSRGWGYTPAAVLVIFLLLWLLVIWAGFVPFLLPWTAPVPPAPVPVPAVPPAG